MVRNRSTILLFAGLLALNTTPLRALPPPLIAPLAIPMSLYAPGRLTLLVLHRSQTAGSHRLYAFWSIIISMGLLIMLGLILNTLAALTPLNWCIGLDAFYLALLGVHAQRSRGRVRHPLQQPVALVAPRPSRSTASTPSIPFSNPAALLALASLLILLAALALSVISQRDAYRADFLQASLHTDAPFGSSATQSVRITIANPTANDSSIRVAALVGSRSLHSYRVQLRPHSTWSTTVTRTARQALTVHVVSLAPHALSPITLYSSAPTV